MLGDDERHGARRQGTEELLQRLIASMTKSVTALAVLLLRDRGALRLDDRLDEHLPWASSLRAAADGHPIELRDLLTMTAGLPTDDPWGDRQEDLPLADFDALVAGLSFAAVPRTAWEYSNSRLRAARPRHRVGVRRAVHAVRARAAV